MTFEDFLTEYRKAGRENAANTYGFIWGPFQRWMTANNRGVDKFALADIQDYLNARPELKTRTKNLAITVIKHFAKWLLARTLDPQDRMRLEQIRGMMMFKVERKLKRRSLTLDELSLLIESADDKDSSLIYLLAYTGVRKSELQSLRSPDFANNKVVVWAKKTKSERVLFFNTEFKRVLNAAISRGYLKLSPASLNKRFVKYNHVLEGIRLTPHVLRRTFNTHMRRKISDALLRVLMGHVEKTMTDVYDQTWDEEIKAAMVDKHYLADFHCPARIQEVC